MNKKFITLCFIFSLSSTYCTLCSEKATLKDDEDEDTCWNLDTSEHKICIYDKTKKGCVEKGCTDLEADKCSAIGSWYDENSKFIKCIQKTDKSGCELNSCQDLVSNCDRFSFGNSDEKCVMNSDNTHCEIKKCSDLKSDCGNFIPEEFRYKCVQNDLKTGCESKLKNCDEFDKDKCDEFYDSTITNKKCLLDSTTNKCKLLACEDLPSSECTKYELYEEDEVCAPNGDKCKIQTCSDFSKDVCETIKFSSENYKCTYSSEKNTCTFIKCSDLTSNCGQFVPLDPLIKCAYDDEEERCDTRYKDCEELSAGQCDLFNIEDILEDVGKKCVEDNGKCVLGSKKLEYSILVLFLLFFLF